MRLLVHDYAPNDTARCWLPLWTKDTDTELKPHVRAKKPPARSTPHCTQIQLDQYLLSVTLTSGFFLTEESQYAAISLGLDLTAGVVVVPEAN